MAEKTATSSLGFVYNPKLSTSSTLDNDNIHTKLLPDDDYLDKTITMEKQQQQQQQQLQDIRVSKWAKLTWCTAGVYAILTVAYIIWSARRKGNPCSDDFLEAASTGLAGACAVTMQGLLAIIFANERIASMFDTEDKRILLAIVFAMGSLFGHAVMCAAVRPACCNA